jgi:TetR/AcrR family transcriptional regulator, transcriptional repressor for nem operon
MARTKEFDKEERLIKARNLFWKQGYHATSMQEIVSTMGLNPGSIYNTYGDKHELFLQCLKNYAAFKLAQYKEAGAGIVSPLGAIEQIIMSAVENTLEEGRSCMAVNTSFELAPSDKAVRSVIEGFSGEIELVFRELIVKAIDQKELKEGIDPALLASFITANFSGFWQTYNLTRNRSLVEGMAGVLIDLLKR